MTPPFSLREGLDVAEAWIRAMGPAGFAAFALAYIGATLLLVPTWPFTLVAGAVFGLRIGFPLVIVTATCSATVAFLVARHALRERVQARLARHRLLRAVDHAVRREGWKVALLLRLSPLVPFGAQNYVFGVSSIRLTHFVAATAVGIVPATAVYLAIGAAGREALHGAQPARWGLLAAGAAATFAATWIVGRAARRRLALD